MSMLLTTACGILSHSYSRTKEFFCALDMGKGNNFFTLQFGGLARLLNARHTAHDQLVKQNPDQLNQNQNQNPAGCS